MNEEQQPATKADVTQLQGDVTQLRADVTQLRADLTESENRLIEHLRHIETSLLTAFHNYAQGANLDTATLARMDAFEQRVLALEMRLPPSAHQ